MYVLHNLRPNFCSKCQIKRLHTSGWLTAKKVLSKKYTDTILLPRTSFPVKLEGKKRIERDKQIFDECEFSKQYEWQRKHRIGPEFILHDGPPYANGNPHIGHAVNKILKDMTVRFECSQGRRVHFVTGWDCHGLPIELKAVKGDKNLQPVKIREIAEKFASKSLDGQRDQFTKWGVLTNWDDHYRTMNKDYIKAQLRKFFEIYQKGYIFRGYMPVYWSPSSKTALAEAELEYNPEHRSTSVYVRFRLTSSSSKLDKFSGQNVYSLIWTTTPWSLLANQAICYNERESYSLLEYGGDVYIVASKLVDSDGVRRCLKDCRILDTVSGADLAGCFYVHPLYPDVDRPLLGGDHVTSSSGTGLVHTAPAHGQDDFKIGLEHNLSLDCPVDENGMYLDTVGFGLAGSSILGEGTDRIIELLKSDILLEEDFIHSYPYDWRTKKPVFIRASKQWFFDTNKLKEKALQAARKVKIQPQSAVNGFQGVIERRPYWCISRQRVWGTPIPVIYNLRSDESVVTEELIGRYCDLIDQHGTGFWWKLDIAEILEGTGLDPSEHRLGDDILDIWFDSGISWAAVLGRQADLYLEGLDQFSGWFYTSLFTGVALTEEAPYKEIFVHGFTLDENGNKMSKSLGNVVDPRDIVDGTKKKPAKGVDVLRWWVGLHASGSTSVLVGDNILSTSQMEVNKIRNMLRFCLGQINSLKSDRMVDYTELMLLDKILLHKLRVFQESALRSYKDKEYNKVCLSVLAFISDVSASHLHLAKDRLYCDAESSLSRRSALTGLFNLTQGLLGVLAPVVPHLAEESANSVEILRSPTEVGWYSDEAWYNSQLLNSLPSLEDIRDRINKEFSKPAETKLTIKADKERLEDLKLYSCEDLAEVLGVLSVNLVQTDSQGFDIEGERSEGAYCERCRRPQALNDHELCKRCSDVLQNYEI